MNLNTVKLKNISSENISLNAYTIVPNEVFVLFNTNDITTYDIGLELSTTCNGVIDILCESNKLQMILDDSIIANQSQRNDLYLWVNSLYVQRKIGYFKDDFYFDMQMNKLIIRNPFNDKRYAVQLTEV